MRFIWINMETSQKHKFVCGRIYTVCYWYRWKNFKKEMLHSLCYKYLCGQNIFKKSWSCSNETSGWQSETPIVRCSHCRASCPTLCMGWSVSSAAGLRGMIICHLQIRLQKTMASICAFHFQSLICCYGGKQVAMLWAACGQAHEGAAACSWRNGGLPMPVSERRRLPAPGEPGDEGSSEDSLAATSWQSQSRDH